MAPPLGASVRRSSAPPHAGERGEGQGSSPQRQACQPSVAPELDEFGDAVLRSEDLDFAMLELWRLEAWPHLEIRVVAKDAPPHEEGIVKLMAFINEVLFSKEAARGFGLTYDLRHLKHPSVNMLLTIARWAAEPERQHVFKTRCVASSTCVPAGWRFVATRAAMSAFFMVTPPTCKTYLLTDFDREKAEVQIFEPPANDQQAEEDSMSVEKTDDTDEKAADTGGVKTKIGAIAGAVWPLAVFLLGCVLGCDWWPLNTVIDVLVSLLPAQPLSGALGETWTQRSCVLGLFGCSLVFMAILRNDGVRERRRFEEEMRAARQTAARREAAMQERMTELQDTCKQLQARCKALEAAVPWVGAAEKSDSPTSPRSEVRQRSTSS